MKIITLGTSHGDSTYCRFNSSTAYQTEDGVVYLVDAGAPVEALMKRKGLSISNVRAVFITHMHDDHAGGLTGLLKQIIKYPQGRTFPVSIHFPEERGISAFKNWFSSLHEPADHASVEYVGVDDGLIYEDEALAVTAIRTEHLRTRGRTEGDPCSFAYVLHFKKEEKWILHTGDLRRDFSDFPKISGQQHFDVCLCEATHYRPEAAADMLTKARFDRLIFIHIGDRWHDFREGEDALLAYCKDYPYPVTVAHDGDEFNL